MVRILIGLAAALALQACGTLSESQCRGGDWRGIGQGDGERGFGPERVSEHAQACGAYGVRPAHAEYDAGRQAGLARFCTPERAFQLGALGDAYLGVCPKESEPQFVAALARGRQVRPYTPALHPFYEAIEQAERALAGAQTEAERARLRARLLEQEWWVQHMLKKPSTFLLD